MTFGEKLQMLRQRAGMSQDALAEQLHVSRQAVSRWERDETMPETEKVVALADLFDVTTDELLRPQRQGAQTREPVREKQAGHDMIGRRGYLAKTKGYLLGWVLIGWGVLDLILVVLVGLGVLNFMRW